MGESRSVLFTVGHSTHSMEAFLGLLRQHNIDQITDVRSVPFSRRQPQFNREAVSATLRAEGIEYVFLGRELGARREEPDCYDAGHVSYRKIAALPLFQQGLRRVQQDAAMRRVAMMCAEKEPLNCHRTILICRNLRGADLAIRHILADGGIEEHSATEQRLVKSMSVARTLFEQDLSVQALIERAYEKREQNVAYRPREEHPAGPSSD